MVSILFCLAMILAGQANATDEKPAPKVSDVPLSADQTAVYRAFVTDYMAGPRATIHVAEFTSTFAPDAGDFAGCMKGFGQAKPLLEVHSLREVFEKSKTVVLVDPSRHVIQDPEDGMRQGQGVDDAVTRGIDAGLMTLSEVMLDSSRTRAAFYYSFHCGRLCGHGGTVVYVKSGGKWVRSKHECGSWIS